MRDRFISHIKSQFPMLFNKRIGLAISGGLDSVVLSRLLFEAGVKPCFIHVNFNLRGAESDADEDFVKNLAEQYDIKFFKMRADTNSYALQHKCSIQMAARELRYDFFKKLVKDDQLDFILTAHHLDDQLETFLINLGRGTGLKGLTGIPEQTDYIVRPLLPFSREEIEVFAQNNNITWREDRSNLSDKYLRNNLRHNVIPGLKDALPNLMNALPSTLSHLKDSKYLSEVEIARFRESEILTTPETVKIPIQSLLNTSNAKAYLFELLQGKGFDITDAINLLDAETGKIIYGAEHRLIKNRENLLLTAKNKPVETFEVLSEINKPIEAAGMIFNSMILETTHPLETIKGLIDDNTLLLDADQITFPLILRNKYEGDKMRPLGIKGQKKISDLLIDNKISLIDKEKVLVLEHGGNILWLVGIRSSELHKITQSTKSILKIWFTN